MSKGMGRVLVDPIAKTSSLAMKLCYEIRHKKILKDSSGPIFPPTTPYK